jgi:N-methylhydantoinase A
MTAAVSHEAVRVGIDVGGTFTDLVAVVDGRVVVGKALSTGARPADGLLGVLRDTLDAAGIDPGRVTQVVHGTTLVTNTLLERRGADTGLITTEGFRDVLEIRREHRFELYDTRLRLPKPLIARDRRREVGQRTLADGTALIPLDHDAVREVAADLLADGVESVAIVFLHSYVDPSDEVLARSLVGEVAPQLSVSISAEVAPEMREFERTSTTAINAYVRPLVTEYLDRVTGGLADAGVTGPLFVMQSAGGILQPDVAARLPVRLLESGPAGGVIAAAGIGRAAGADDLLSFDMGGTTAKLAVVSEGQPTIASQFEADRAYRFLPGSGLPVTTPVVDMIEIGAGGGSIAALDALGLVVVGPRSAGSEPGPACYGFGGREPTVTDADLLLGRLAPGSFLGGTMRLDVDAAEAALASLAEPLGLDPLEAAVLVAEQVEESMANAARVHVLERGQDAAALPLLAFGGAGPVHADGIARRLGMPRIIVPPHSGVASALGFLMAPPAFEHAKTLPMALDELDFAELADVYKELEAAAVAVLAQAGVQLTTVIVQRRADMRYVGQGRDLAVPVPNGPFDAGFAGRLRAAFERRYVEVFGRLGPDTPIEARTWRALALGPSPQVRTAPDAMPPVRSAPGYVHRDRRPVYHAQRDSMVTTAVVDRYALRSGDRLDAPVVVEERESTLVVTGPGTVTVDSHQNLLVDLPQAP